MNRLEALTHQKRFWYAFNSVTITVWIFVLIGFFSPYGTAVTVIWGFFVITFGIIHPLEIMFAIPIGQKKGFSKFSIILKTILFGFGWWIPVKRGLFTPVPE